MASYTLLEITQLILGEMESDEVNSIADTEEANQVARTIRSCFHDMVTELDLYEQEVMLELNPSGDVTKPTLMTIPSDTKRIKWIKYDNKLSTDMYSKYKDVLYMDLKPFLEMMSAYNTSTSGVGQMVVVSNTENFNVMYRNDKMPQYYTTVDDTQLLFDSYLASEDDTLQKSKTLCGGIVFPTFDLVDSAVPPINEAQFPFLINKAKARCFAVYKQQDNVNARDEARKQKIAIQRQKGKSERAKPIFTGPRYGKR